MNKKLGFGLMRLPQSDPADATKIDHGILCKMADRYLEADFNYFDTAFPYHGGNSEIAFRECVAKRHPRDAYTITDKLSFFVLQKVGGFLCRSAGTVRFAASLPNVAMVLSGMTTPEQMEDDLSYMDDLKKVRCLFEG